MIKYIGSKRVLLPAIVDAVRACSGVTSVIDLFSGTSRVGHALKREGLRVSSNDHNAYAHALATCYVQADAEDVLTDAQRHIDELNRVSGCPGYVTQEFCERSRFFHPRNGERIDAIRDEIAARALDPELNAVLLVSLMEAADRVDSTTGVQMAYLKSWAPRAHNELTMRVPDVLCQAAAGKSRAVSLDATEAARCLSADLAYLDPPYNQHSYLGNYHVWETLVRWDAPESYGTACKRVDCRERRSDFNSRRRIHEAMRTVVERLDARIVMVSLNDEGYITPEELCAMLRTRGDVGVTDFDYKRYVGATIGIHNRDGKKVGRIGKLRNRELLFIVGAEPLPPGFRYVEPGFRSGEERS